MKKGTHPENYRLVAFKAMSNEDVFITKSTAETKETIIHEGVEYPVVKMEISRTSHPFTQVNLNLLILQVVLINSKLNTLNSTKTNRIFQNNKELHICEAFFME